MVVLHLTALFQLIRTKNFRIRICVLTIRRMPLHGDIHFNNKVCLKMSLVSGFRQQRNIFKKLVRSFYRSEKNKRCFSSGHCLLNKLNANLRPISLHHRCYSSKTQFDLADSCDVRSNAKLFDFHNEWPTDVKTEFLRDMILIEDFVTETEEESLCAETQKSMKRMRYQYDHWDDAIHGYREMEKTDWRPENELLFQKVRNKAFVANVLPHVHILDLAADGIIKPHVDSSRYCGSTIAGLSLMTDCIMRLRRVDEKEYEQNKLDQNTPDSPQPKHQSASAIKKEFDYFADVLLKRRSLYIMKDSARYKFSHEVLATNSLFKGNEIVKGRRISIICRNQA